MESSSIDVYITVHVEEHCKFLNRPHIGHERFFRLLLDDRCKVPLTLLIARVKEEPSCPSIDRGLFEEIQARGVMELGLHVHPALSRFTYEHQQRVISHEWHRMVEETGIIPKTFSGGHWCINASTLKIVRQLGMKVDASVAPGCGVMACNGAILRYSDRLRTPYWISTERIDEEDPGSCLLEMPVSVRGGRAIIDMTTTPLSDLLVFFSALARQGRKRQYLHMTFHSYDVLLPDGSRNFFYDKIMHVIGRLHDFFDEVRLRTCSSCHEEMAKEAAK